VAVNFSSERRNTEEEHSDFQLPSKRRRLKKCSFSEFDVQNVSGEVEIVGLAEVNRKAESIPTNAVEDELVRIKEEIIDQDYGNSVENELDPVSSSTFFVRMIDPEIH